MQKAKAIIHTSEAEEFAILAVTKRTLGDGTVRFTLAMQGNGDLRELVDHVAKAVESTLRSNPAYEFFP